MSRRDALALGPPCLLAAAGVLGCSSSPGAGTVDCSRVSPAAVMTADPASCYPDNDGITNQVYTIAIGVDDTGFTWAAGADAGARESIATQNDSRVTLTLTNGGTKPHGFQVGCVSVCSSYPSLPAGCSPLACFPSGATIAPIAPGTSATVTFETPTPDNLIYPFSSSAPGDRSVPGLGGGQWILM